jgi:plasmid replication initiation protein
MAQKQLRLPGETVKMSNALARARVKTGSVFCGRIIAGFVSLIKNEDADFQKYSIPVRSVMGKSMPDGQTFARIAKAADLLLQSIVELPSTKPDTFRKYTLVSSMEYDAGVLTGSFHPDLKPFLVGLKERFTMYPLAEYLALPTAYAQRLYEILKSWDDQISVEIPIEKLHDMLDTPPSLRSRFADFRRRVLIPATEAITGTSLRYTWEPVKQGKNYTAILFRFKNRPDQKQPELPAPFPPVARRRLAPLSAEDLEARRALLRAQAAAMRAAEAKEVAS